MGLLDRLFGTSKTPAPPPAAARPATPSGGGYPTLLINDSIAHHQEFTCDPSKLDSSRRTIAGAAHYASPTFFREAVLELYTVNGHVFDVGPTGAPDEYQIRAKIEGQWNLRFIKDSGYVIAQLGAIGEIPGEHRKHFAKFNVAPVDGLS